MQRVLTNKCYHLLIIFEIYDQQSLANFGARHPYGEKSYYKYDQQSLAKFGARHPYGEKFDCYNAD